jgi:hypothetical protein
MALTVISLKSLLNSGKSEEEINQLLFSFCSLPVKETSKQHDVEYFLHNKAIHFERLDISRTYLVLSYYQGNYILVGYFSLSNKPIVITKKNFTKLSVSLRKRLMGIGHKTDTQNYEVKGYLLGQLGKNFSKESIASRAITGRDLMKLANDAMLVSYEAVGGRIFYLECEDEPKLKEFYKSEGFAEILDFKSANEMCLFVRAIKG